MSRKGALVTLAYLIAVPWVDGVRKCASTGDTCPADVGLIGLGAEIEARHLAQLRLVLVGAFRELVARLGLVRCQGVELGICRGECICGKVVMNSSSSIAPCPWGCDACTVLYLSVCFTVSNHNKYDTMYVVYM
mgnify:CR=1 FL=1